MLHISAPQNNFIRARKFLMLASVCKRSRSAPSYLSDSDKTDLKSIRKTRVRKIRYELSEVLDKVAFVNPKKNVSVELCCTKYLEVKPFESVKNSLKKKTESELFEKTQQLKVLKGNLSIMKSNLLSPTTRHLKTSKNSLFSKELPSISMARKLKSDSKRANPESEQLEPWGFSNEFPLDF